MQRRNPSRVFVLGFLAMVLLLAMVFPANAEIIPEFASRNFVWNCSSGAPTSYNLKWRYANNPDTPYVVFNTGSAACFSTLPNLPWNSMLYTVATAQDAQARESAESNSVVYNIPPRDSDGDGISDEREMFVFGTDPNNWDTDGDGISDGDELDLWGADWYLDYDGDGLINLIDPDADGDGHLDGQEVNSGSNPLSSTSRPPVILEDAEDGNLFGWTKPTTATLSNFPTDNNFWFDRFMGLTGTGTYTLKKYDPATSTSVNWDIATHKVLYLEVRTTADFFFMVEFSNANGVYKVVYSTKEPLNQRRISGTTVYIGITTGYKDGQRYSLARDLVADLDGQLDTMGRLIPVDKIRVVSVYLYTSTPAPWMELDNVMLRTELPTQP